MRSVASHRSVFWQQCRRVWASTPYIKQMRDKVRWTTINLNPHRLILFIASVPLMLSSENLLVVGRLVCTRGWQQCTNSGR
jgi:hypothetical protein